jgi:hypothetical protein
MSRPKARLREDAPRLPTPLGIFKGVDGLPILAERVSECHANGVLTPDEEVKVIVVLTLNDMHYMLTDEQAATVALVLAEAVEEGRESVGLR